MQESGDASATLARHSNSRFSQLLRRCIEGGLHPGEGGRCLHPGEKGVEFAGDISDRRFGLATDMALPDGSTLTLYEPKHPTALR